MDNLTSPYKKGNMRKLIFVSLVFLMVACSKSEESEEQVVSCIEMQEDQNFERVPFKEDYSIQLPDGHSGLGLELLLGTRFSVSTELGTKLYYEYLCVTDCRIFFGEILDTPIPDQIIGFPALPMEVLDNKREFCVLEDVRAVLYYSSNVSSLSHGRLFMKVDSDFKEGLLIDFDINNISEVEDIIKTIKEE